MHLYDDIGDASSSLRGSTSSWRLLLKHINGHSLNWNRWLAAVIFSYSHFFFLFQITQLFATCTIYLIAFHYYASPSSGEAYRDRQITSNFELWVEIFLCADMFPCEDSKTVSVCLYVRAPRKEITIASSISVLH